MVAAALREWDRQHEWLHSPEERAADRRDAEQELARVVAALRVWHAAAAACSSNSSGSSRQGSNRQDNSRQGSSGSR